MKPVASPSHAVNGDVSSILKFLRKMVKKTFFNGIFQSSATFGLNGWKKGLLLNYVVCIRLRNLSNTQLDSFAYVNAKHNCICCCNCFCCKCRLDKSTQKLSVRCLIVQAVSLLKCIYKIAVITN